MPVATPRGLENRLATVAALTAAVMLAHAVAAKAIRDALFLSTVGAAELPRVVVGAALASMLLAFGFSRAVRTRAPARVAGVGFALSALLQVAEWMAWSASPHIVTTVIYLHIVSFGSVLMSGFWSAFNEVFDPRTARQTIGRILAGGTAGGLVGAILAERISSWTSPVDTLLFLASLQAVSALGVFSLRPRGVEEAPASKTSTSTYHIFKETSLLRDLATLVVLTSIGSAILEYTFKASAASTFVSGEHLVRYFALFYAGSNLVGFIVQLGISRSFMERFGLATSSATLPWATIAGSVLFISFPSVASAVIARGVETIVRTSFYRSACEIFLTPIEASEKRAVKAIVDVVFDRSGEIAAGLLIASALFLLPNRALPVLLCVAITTSICALFVTRRLHRGYVDVLEDNLSARANAVDASAFMDHTTLNPVEASNPGMTMNATIMPGDAVLSKVINLRSGDAVRVKHALAKLRTVEPAICGHVIALLHTAEFADDAERALRRSSEHLIGALTDVLLSDRTTLETRLRIPRILASKPSTRAANALLEGLSSERFDVRVRCARALARVRARNPEIAIDAARIFAAVEREVSVERGVWNDHRADPTHAREELQLNTTDLDFDHTSDSLEHVFTLLSLSLPPEPLSVAFRGLRAQDRALRGTALEYIDAALEEPIRSLLLEHLEPGSKVTTERRRSSSSTSRTTRRKHGTEIPRRRDTGSLHRRVVGPALEQDADKNR